MIYGGKQRHRHMAILLVLIFIVGFWIFKVNRKKDQIVDSSKLKIGLCMDSLIIERWQIDRDIFMARAKELGAEVIVQNAGSDSNEQIIQIKHLINQGVNVLVIVPNNSDALAPVVAAAKKKGIKVISYDRLIRKANVDLYITFDNVKVGELMGEAIVAKVPKGNYVIINGNKQDYNAIEFNKGYMNAIKPSIDNGNIKIVNEVWSENWNEEEAIKCVEETIASGVKINGIVAANDSLAQVVIEVLSENRLAGKVSVVGGDADLSACQRVVEGLQLMTVYKPIVKMARDAAEAAVKMGKDDITYTNDTINDGLFSIPTLREFSTQVTTTNMLDIVVKSNFHKIEDIYRNIPRSEWPKEK